MKLKRILAVAMATIMVMGMSITAFADEPATNGTSEGAGTSEGHVEKKATSVILPTIASGTTPFAYTMDPEGLVVATAHGKYGNDVVFPATGDTHVYFDNGDDASGKKQYLNSSAAQTVINKSSYAINVTVKAEAVASAGGKDIPLAAKADLTSATAAALYLGLIVGEEDAVEITDTAATKTVKLDGTPANFKVAVTSTGNAYEYRELTLTEYKALDGNSSKTQDDFDATWANVDFSVEGATTENLAIAADTTAPKLKVTWSWEEAPTDVAPSIATTTYTLTANAALNVPVSLGAGSLAATGIASVKNGASALPTDAWSYSNGVLTFTAARVNSIANAKVSRTYTVVFNDTAGTSVDITLDGTGN
ncbi:hypothetical protein SAMN04487831_10773 [Pseudobutyrivibrio sp. UC1225]|uniref:hypothetical protein n=1 Tax=Pseudobutyrivibrio sp. UC1225 TaxID=1798185 RepID=UPI0008ED0A20|nr:hypothetical protein [Pseudobutyrivibrio sp. UC1225]SFO06883.1 hypothetical protein SAMN04487831_10773 [Pseudobutyrivibrio sp. UC1225]